MYTRDMYGNYYGPDDYDKVFLDINGNPIKRTPSTHPYNYDEYVVWKEKGCDIKNSSAVYSDRLYQWDSKKFNECCEKVGQIGQYFHSTSRPKIQEFLSLYFEKEIKLTAIIQGCNQSSGFPYWVFCYEEVE